jgi:hypothetical protein
MRRLQIFAQRELWADAISVRIGQRDDSGRLSVAIPLTMKEVDEATSVEPSLMLRKEDAQLLMDELWHCGVRPSEGTGSAGSLAATQAHLKDMQTVAFGLLRKDGVEVSRG